MEKDSFRDLFDAYHDRIFGYILTLSHSRYLAEEITQEIFIKLWLCRDTLHEIDNPDGYIFAIARNKMLNHLRKAAYDSKLLRDLQGFMVGGGVCGSNNIEERTVVAEYEKLLGDALTLLSPQRRLVYQLSRHQGLNHEEIARQLQLSRNTVKNHLVEALRFIRSYLGQHGTAAGLAILFLGYC